MPRLLSLARLLACSLVCACGPVDPPVGGPPDPPVEPAPSDTASDPDVGPTETVWTELRPATWSHDWVGTAYLGWAAADAGGPVARLYVETFEPGDPGIVEYEVDRTVVGACTVLHRVGGTRSKHPDLPLSIPRDAGDVHVTREDGSTFGLDPAYTEAEDTVLYYSGEPRKPRAGEVLDLHAAGGPEYAAFDLTLDPLPAPIRVLDPAPGATLPAEGWELRWTEPVDGDAWVRIEIGPDPAFPEWVAACDMPDDGHFFVPEAVMGLVGAGQPALVIAGRSAAGERILADGRPFGAFTYATHAVAAFTAP